jgi:hypothetical protein
MANTLTPEARVRAREIVADMQKDHAQQADLMAKSARSIRQRAEQARDHAKANHLASASEAEERYAAWHQERANALAALLAPAERDDRDDRIDDLTARLAQANTHLAELGFVRADAPAERAEPQEKCYAYECGNGDCVLHDTPTDWVECVGARCPVSGQIVEGRPEPAAPPSPVTPEPPAPMPSIEQGDVVVYMDDSPSILSSPRFCFHIHQRDGGEPPPARDKIVAIFRDPLWRRQP